MNERKALIDYRRSRASETLRDAAMLLDAGSLSSAVNRIYYAVFYEVIALLACHDLSSAKHSGVRALFNEHFVKTGKVAMEHGRFYSRMFEFRQKNDYADFTVFEEASVRRWLESAGLFIDAVERAIESIPGFGSEVIL